ncbi:MAG: tRNA (adenosine(37)-N6)-threonylcarbamoyltransferase complex dimerization subunit type 1 TsaB [Thermoleophilia bacterium]
MSYILALETATTACSAALCTFDGAVVAESLSLEGPAHAQRLMPGVHEVLDAAEATWASIDAIAVSLGPGAFTGLRIGVATARALAQADGHVDLIGVPTCTALALALADVAGGVTERRLIPLIDGRRRELFAAVYEVQSAGGAPRQVEDVQVVAADELGEWLAARGPAVVGGDGAVLHADKVPGAVRCVSSVVAPTAAYVGRAAALGVPGLINESGAVLPIYGRAPDAARWAFGGAGGRT